MLFQQGRCKRSLASVLYLRHAHPQCVGRPGLIPLKLYTTRLTVMLWQVLGGFVKWRHVHGLRKTPWCTNAIGPSDAIPSALAGLNLGSETENFPKRGRLRRGGISKNRSPRNGEPETVTIDKSDTNLGALDAINAERETLTLFTLQSLSRQSHRRGGM
jgi:hypothetical protein